MLKFLRKYNTYILVVGGCLLMVAFLLQGVLSDLSKRGLFGGTAFKIGSKKVTQEEFGLSAREYGAVTLVIDSAGIFSGRAGVAALGGGENAEHWYLLTREAELAGLVGGPHDGDDYLEEISREMAQRISRDSTQVETYRVFIRLRMDSAMDTAMGQAHLTPDQLKGAFAKLRGAVRLQNAYMGSARYSARRLASVARSKEDAVAIDYFLVPADRELTGIPDPDEAAIKAHYEKFKETPRGSGDFGIGYKLPPRIKLEWLELNRQLIADAVTVDGVEVEKRFLALYPNGQVPDGKTVEGEHSRIETDVRKELADKILKTADLVIRGELDRPLRKLDRDGDYVKLPADWATVKPDFNRIRDAVSARLLDQYKIVIPAPRVTTRAANWIEQGEIRNLEGIGAAYAKRGQSTRMADAIFFGVREIADPASAEPGFQVGVPFPEAIDNAAGNKYYFTILDARKESPPDSMEDVRPEIVKNIKRLAAYEKLKLAEPGLKNLAVTQGLDAIAKVPAGSSEIPLGVRPNTISRRQAAVGMDAGSQALDTPVFREGVLAATASLDPMADLTKLDPALTTFSMPLDKALSICVYRAKKILPLTAEKFRTNQNSLAFQASRDEFGSDPNDNPFSFEEMKQRLGVTDPDGRSLKSDKDKKDAAKQ